MFKKIRQFRERYISTKAVAIWVINKKLPTEWGMVSDIDLDRDSKDLTLTLIKSQVQTVVSVTGYHVEMTLSGQAYFRWRRVAVEGTQKSTVLKKFKGRNFIEIPSQYVSLVGMFDKHSTQVA